jgi:hypothetical protein
LRYTNVDLWEEPTITQDDVDTTKLILEGVKTPVAIKGKDPFILEKLTPIFITSNSKIYQHVSSQADALASHYYRYGFDREMLHYRFCNDTHDNCITDSQWIQTLEEAETVHLSDADTDPEKINITDEEQLKPKKPRTTMDDCGTLHKLTEDDLLALITLGICKLASEHPDFLTDNACTVSQALCYHITLATCECPVCHPL